METFTVEGVDEGTVAFKSFHGKYLSADSQEEGSKINANKDERGLGETFTIMENKKIKKWNSYVALKSKIGRYIVAKKNGGLNIWRFLVKGFEKFYPECLGT